GAIWAQPCSSTPCMCPSLSSPQPPRYRRTARAEQLRELLSQEVHRSFTNQDVPGHEDDNRHRLHAVGSATVLGPSRCAAAAGRSAGEDRSEGDGRGRETFARRTDEDVVLRRTSEC